MLIPGLLQQDNSTPRGGRASYVGVQYFRHLVLVYRSGGGSPAIVPRLWITLYIPSREI